MQTMLSSASVSPVIEGLLRDAQTGDTLRTVLDWLAVPPGRDMAGHARELSAHMDLLEQVALAPAVRVRILDIFHDRTLSCSAMLRPQLAASALPVEAELRNAADQLCASCMRLARGYLEALRTQAAHRPARVAGHAMMCVLDACMLNVLVGATDPAGMWGVANALLMQSRAQETPPANASAPVDTEHLFRQLVALSLAQTPNLAPADFFSVAEYVRSYSGAVQIQAQTPHRDLDSWYWLDDECDRGPTALLRVPADSARAEHIIFCSCQRLGQVLGQHLDLIDEGGSSAGLHLPACLNDPATRRLMRTLQARWMAMPRRQHARRERVQQVRMLIGFDPIWHLLDQRDETHDWASITTGWEIINDSANGFALRLTDGRTGLVRPGAPVMIRGVDSRKWLICVVRWARSTEPDRMEIGVELLSHGAQSATVLFHDDTSGRMPVAALRLPPLARQRSHPCLMLPRGTAKGRNMVIAHETGTRCRLGDARLSDLDLQTQAFELFELDEISAI
jgi:hypothetical protein